jgi:hypothetical protein
MEKFRIYTLNDLQSYKDILDKILKGKIPNFSHTLIKEANNPWGWSPLADIQIFIKPCLIHTVQVLYCGSTSCLDIELRELIADWVATIETEEARAQTRNDLIQTELIFSALDKMDKLTN